MTAEQVDHGYTAVQAQDDIAATIGSVDRMGEALTQTDVTDPPNSPAAGSIQYTATGQQKYASSDGQNYNTGRLTIPSTGSLSLTTSLQTAGGMTASLAVGTWHIYARILISNPGTAGQGAISYQVTGSGGLTASNGRFSVTNWVSNSAVPAADYNTLGNLVTCAVVPGTGGANQVADLHGIFIISVAGTFAIQMKQAATAACSVVQYGTFCEVFPVT